MIDTAFDFIPRAARSAKPRRTGLTEIRGPYYSAYGFVDHSQIVQLEALRSGIWGTKSTWGRIQNIT